MHKFTSDLNAIRHNAREQSDENVSEDASLMGLVQNDDAVFGQHKVLSTGKHTQLIQWQEGKRIVRVLDCVRKEFLLLPSQLYIWGSRFLERSLLM